MSVPKELVAGRYAVTVPAPSDKAFTDWRMANRARVGITEVRQTSGYQADDPNSIATYEIKVSDGPPLPVPAIKGGGFDTLGKPGGPQTVDDYSPTADPSYHANDPPDTSSLPTMLVVGGVVLLAFSLLLRRLIP